MTQELEIVLWSGLIWSLVLTPAVGFVLGIVVYFIKKRKSN